MEGRPYLIVFLSVLTLSKGELFIDKILIAQGNSYVVYGNGTTVQQEPRDNWIACGFGNGLVFLEQENGDCNTKKSFAINRGTVNQISLDPERDFYTGSKFTVIDVDSTETSDRLVQDCILRASIRGSRAKEIDYKTQGTIVTSKVGGFNLLNLKRGSFVEMVSEGHCCSCTVGSCGKRITAGNTDDFAVCGAGPGETLFTYQRNENCNTTIGSCLFGNPLGVDAYLPSETSTKDSEPIAVTFNTYLIKGLVSRSWKNTEVERSGAGRKKRFVEFLALAIATAVQIEVGILFNAVTAGFAACDRNDRKIFDELLIHEQEILDNLQAITRTNIRQQETDLAIKSLNDQDDKYYEILSGLIENVESIESFLLYLSNFLTIGSSTLDNAANKVLSEYQSRYPERKILTTSRNTVLVTIFSYTDNIITGNCKYSYCDGQNCQLEGTFYHYQKEGVLTTEELPFLTMGSCGIYFRTDNQDLKYAVLYSTDFQQAVNYLNESHTEFCFVLRSPCFTPMDTSNYLLKETSIIQENLGVRVTMSADQEYFISCEDTNETSSTILKNNGLLCNVTQSAVDLRKAVENFHRINWTLESAEAAFKAAGGDIVGAIVDVFNGIGKGIGSAIRGLMSSLFGVDVLSVLVIIIIIALVLESIVLGLLVKKVFFNQNIEIKSRETGL